MGDNFDILPIHYCIAVGYIYEANYNLVNSCINYYYSNNEQYGTVVVHKWHIILLTHLKIIEICVTDTSIEYT